LHPTSFSLFSFQGHFACGLVVRRAGFSGHPGNFTFFGPRIACGLIREVDQGSEALYPRLSR